MPAEQADDSSGSAGRRKKEVGSACDGHCRRRMSGKVRPVRFFCVLVLQLLKSVPRRGILVPTPAWRRLAHSVA